MNLYETAITKLTKLYPELAKKIVAFKELTDGDTAVDNATTTVGCFVLKSGGNQFYIPVIYTGSTMHPIDSIFDAGNNQFYPITRETVDYVVSTQKVDMGKGVKKNNKIVKNPSVRHLVEPPKTGKHIYSSDGRLLEFLASLPAGSKKVFLDAVTKNKGLAKSLHDMYDLNEIKKSLQMTTVEKPITKEVPGIRFITAHSGREKGEKLPEEIIQQILGKGYAVIGNHEYPKVAIESSPGIHQDRFSTLDATEEKKAYCLVRKDGTHIKGIVPQLQDIHHGTNGAKDVYDYNLLPPTDRVNRVIILEDGTCMYNNGSKPVIRTEDVDYSDVVDTIEKDQGFVSLPDFEQDCKYAIFEYGNLIGVYYVNSIIIKDGCTQLNVRSDMPAHDRGLMRIECLPNYKGSAQVINNTIMTGPACVGIKVKKITAGDEFETSVFSACQRQEFMEARNLEEKMTLSHSSGSYAINGTPMSKVAMARTLIMKKGLDSNLAESFIKSAETKYSVDILLTKEAAVPSEIPEHGEFVPAPSSGSGTATDRKTGALSVNNLKEATKLKDKAAVESVLISELLQNPDMNDTIDSYLPNIKETMDHLGRIILMVRMKSTSITDKLGHENVGDMLTSLRNVYRMLGDNYLKLCKLTNTLSGVDENEKAS